MPLTYPRGISWAYVAAALRSAPSTDGFGAPQARSVRRRRRPSTSTPSSHCVLPIALRPGAPEARALKQCAFWPAFFTGWGPSALTCARARSAGAVRLCRLGDNRRGLHAQPLWGSSRGAASARSTCEQTPCAPQRDRADRGRGRANKAAPSIAFVSPLDSPLASPLALRDEDRRSSKVAAFPCLSAPLLPSDKRAVRINFSTQARPAPVPWRGAIRPVQSLSRRMAANARCRAPSTSRLATYGAPGRTRAADSHRPASSSASSSSGSSPDRAARPRRTSRRLGSTSHTSKTAASSPLTLSTRCR
jgi:hypothetical protein